MKAKFSIGDKVKIIRYGHPIWVSKNSNMKFSLLVLSETEKIITYDMEPKLLGLEGVVEKVSKESGSHVYALDGPSKNSWYNEDQLELV